jgi:RND family efflux transporter MFP subunit
MKNIIILSVTLLFVFSCQKQEVDKNTLLNEKKEQLKILTQEIAALEKELNGTSDPLVSKSSPIVTTYSVSKSDFEHFIEIQGIVKAENLTAISSEITGRITKIIPKEGDQVKKGQPLVEIDLEYLEKQMEELKVSLQLASTVFERQSRLWNQNIGSELQFLEAKNNKERIEKSIQSLEIQLKKSIIYAPINGVIEKVITKVGEFAAPGAPILQVLNNNSLTVEANVPENYLKSIRRGDEVDIIFPVLGEKVVGKVNLIGRQIDPSNRTFTVELQIGYQPLLKPNLLAFIYINDFTVKDAVSIPLELIQQEVGGENFIFVLDTSEYKNVAKKISITTGKSFGGKTLIETGLEGNEILIAEGSRGLANGQEVRVKE